jgi:hypothetical protein
LRLNLEVPDRADDVCVKQRDFPGEVPVDEDLPAAAHFPKTESMLTLSSDNSSKA